MKMYRTVITKNAQNVRVKDVNVVTLMVVSAVVTIKAIVSVAGTTGAAINT